MQRLLAAFLAAATLAAPLPASAALTTLSDLFVFGDSLSDGGNSGLATKGLLPPSGFPPSPYFNGQYSNGPVAAEYLWQRYSPGSTSFKPSLGGGTNYAIGGATTGLDNYNQINPLVPTSLQPSFGALGLTPQLGQFHAFVTGGGTFNPATSLFVVWAFPNDVFWALASGELPDQPGVPATPAALITQGIGNIANAIGFLAGLGGQHFLVPNMPDLGQTPFGLGLGDAGSAALTALTGGFNESLKVALTGLDGLLTTAEIVQFDTFDAFKRLRDDPDAFGFTETQRACLDFPAECNPNTWVFWDGVHPTTATHQVLGTMFAAAVPEPGSLALLATVLLLLGMAARFRGARSPR